MDTAQVITQAVIALITMVTTVVTTIVVTKLTLNRGSLGITSKLRARFTPKFRAYIRVVFCLLIFIIAAVFTCQFVAAPDAPPASRLDVFWIVACFVISLLWAGFTTVGVVNLAALYADERAEKEAALKRAWEERQQAEMRPVLDDLKELAEMAREMPPRPEAPKD